MVDEKGYYEVKKDDVMQKDQIMFVRENPSGLTKEGCEEEIKNWKQSRNSVQRKMYEYMLTNCKTFTESGNVESRVIFSRDKEGTPNWLGKR